MDLKALNSLKQRIKVHKTIFQPGFCYHGFKLPHKKYFSVYRCPLVKNTKRCFICRQYSPFADNLNELTVFLYFFMPNDVTFVKVFSLYKRKQKQKTEKMKTTIKQIAAVTFIALLFLVGNAKASSLENNEKTLQLESWMTDYSIWDFKSNCILEYGQETEEALIIENWMTNENVWNLNYFNETEASLELEDWMTNEEVWNKNVQIAESTLTVENWMINDEFWQ